jgi:hypothetical protein
VGIGTGYGLNDGSGFEYRVVQIGSVAHSAYYPMGTMVKLPGMKLTTRLQLVPWSRERGSIIHYPMSSLLSA